MHGFQRIIGPSSSQKCVYRESWRYMKDTEITTLLRNSNCVPNRNEYHLSWFHQYRIPERVKGVQTGMSIQSVEIRVIPSVSGSVTLLIRRHLFRDFLPVDDGGKELTSVRRNARSCWVVYTVRVHSNEAELFVRPKHCLQRRTN